MKTTLAFAVLAWTASTAFAHGEAHTAKKPAYDASQVEERAFSRLGDPRRVTRSVKIGMTDAFRLMPADVALRRGETLKFVVANSGGVRHEMIS